MPEGEGLGGEGVFCLAVLVGTRAGALSVALDPAEAAWLAAATRPYQQEYRHVCHLNGVETLQSKICCFPL